jgi:hypothetical protein
MSRSNLGTASWGKVQVLVQTLIPLLKTENQKLIKQNVEEN